MKETKESQQAKKQMLQCSICNETFENPKTLPCVHTFCEQCLDKVFQSQKSQGQECSCPKCSRVFDGIKSIKEWPIDSRVQLALNILSENKEGNGTDSECLCQLCLEEYDEKNEAVQFCKDCKFPLCDGHVNFHKKIKKTKDHALMPLDQVPKTQMPNNNKVIPSCPDHTNEKLKFICSCSKLICRDCALMEHKPHEYRDIEKTAEEERAHMRQLVKETQADVPQIEKSLSEVIETMENIRKKCVSQCSKVECVSNELKTHIDQRAAKLINKIKQLAEMKLTNLEQQKKYLSDLVFNTSMDDIELVDLADNIELLQMKKQMDERHKELQRMLRTPVRIEHGDAFEVNLRSEMLLTNIGQWGNVTDSDAGNANNKISIEHSIVSDLQMDALLDNETQFTIQLKNEDGQNVEHSNSPDVAIFDSQQKLINYKMEYDEQRAAFKVTYTPRSYGLNVIQVTVNRQHLKNSPFSVRVHVPSKVPTFKFRTKFGCKGKNEGEFDSPGSVATDKEGNIYVSDYSNHRIQVFDSNGIFIKSVGSQGSEYGQFNRPIGIALNSKNDLIIADNANHRVQIFDKNLQFLKALGSKGNSNGQFKFPYGIAVDAYDNIIVADWLNHRIQIFDQEGNWKQTFGKKGSGDAEFNYPSDVVVCKLTGRLFISDTDNHRVQVFDANTNFLLKFGSEGTENGQFYYPRALAVSTCGKYLLACDYHNHRIQVFSATDGSFIKSYGSKGPNDGEFEYPCGIYISPSGHIIISESYTQSDQHRVQIFE